MDREFERNYKFELRAKYEAMHLRRKHAQISSYMLVATFWYRCESIS